MKTENEMYVWAVIVDWTLEVEHNSDVLLCETEELAQAYFKSLVEKDKTENYCNSYNDADSDMSWEESSDYWCIWEEGRYCENHSEIRIEKKRLLAK